MSLLDLDLVGLSVTEGRARRNRERRFYAATLALLRLVAADLGVSLP